MSCLYIQVYVVRLENDSKFKKIMMHSRDVEECVKGLQQYVDIECAQWMSQFGSKIKLNETWLDEINDTFQLMNNDTQMEIETIKQKYMGQLTDLEGKIDEMEKLCDELEEIHDEIEVKIKLNQCK